MLSCRSKRARLCGSASDLYLCLRRVGNCPRRYLFRQVKACHTNPIVRHPVVDVEAIWGSKIVAPVDTRGKNNIVNGPIAFLWKRGR